MKVTDPPGPLVVDLFAGPGGWDTGLAMLGQQLRVVGIEWDRAACLTGHAAGHVRVQADVARFDPSGMAGAHLLIASPPCQAWSRSGKRKGILDQPAIFAHAQRVIAAGEWLDYADAGPLPRRPATAEPTAPEPEEACATCGHPGWAHDQGGFCAFCSDTCQDPIWGVNGPVEVIEPVAMDEGVKYGDEGGMWHDARSPLVLEVIRWVMAVEPANICLEQVPDVLPFWELIARWLRGRGYNAWAGCLSSERYGVPQTRERAIVIASRERAVSAPAATHTAYDSRLSDGGKWHGTDGDLFGAGLEPWVSMAEALGWGLDERPSPTVTAGGTETGGAEVFGNAKMRAAIRNGVPRAMGDVRMANGTVRDVDHPAGTITASLDNGNHRWVYRNGNQANAARRDLEEPAPTVMFVERSNKVEWVYERPATTVQGDPRIAQPGHRDREGGERQFEGESVRVTVQEAAILQSFPADYPWQGTKSAAFRQVGDAVPPRLAAAVIGTCLGLDWQAAVAAHYGQERAA